MEGIAFGYFPDQVDPGKNETSIFGKLYREPKQEIVLTYQT